jgi:hypothetical protein
VRRLNSWTRCTVPTPGAGLVQAAVGRFLTCAVEALYQRPANVHLEAEPQDGLLSFRAKCSLVVFSQLEWAALTPHRLAPFRGDEV